MIETVHTQKKFNIESQLMYKEFFPVTTLVIISENMTRQNVIVLLIFQLLWASELNINIQLQRIHIQNVKLTYAIIFQI